MAPEMISHGGHAREVDVWALGVLLHELFAAYTPFTADDAKSVMRNIAAVKVHVDSICQESLF